MPIAKIGEVHDLKVIDPKTIPHVLNMGELGLSLEWCVHETGHPENVREHVIKRSESYVQQFLELLSICFMDSPLAFPVNVKDTGNTDRDVYHKPGNNLSYLLDCAGTVGLNTFGIVVGTGNTAPDITDYQLQTIVAHGVAGGQLQYSAVSFGAPAADDTTSQLTITRNFANASGGAISVEELGIYCRCLDTAGSTRYFCIVRDVTGGIAVPNGQTLTVNYRPQGVL
ncbi:MAG: hypothetical protein WC551_13505 [Patescibacteria group bacterium]